MNDYENEKRMVNAQGRVWIQLREGIAEFITRLPAFVLAIWCLHCFSGCQGGCRGG